MGIIHHYNDTVADGTATSYVRPSDWNSAHDQIYTLLGNTAGQSTVSGSNIQFSGGNNITLSGSNGSIGIIAPTPGETYSIVGNTGGANSTIAASAGIAFFGGNNITLSANLSSISIVGANQTSPTESITLVGNTAGVAGVTVVGGYVLSGGNNITLSGTSNSIGIYGQAAAPISYLDPYPLVNTQTTALAQGTLYLSPFVCPEDISFDKMRLWVSQTIGTTSLASGVGAYGASAANSNTLDVVIYKRGTGASSNSLQSVVKTLATWDYQISISGTSNSSSVSHNFRYPQGSTTTSQQLTTQTTGGGATAPGATVSYTGLRQFDIPFAGSLAAGNYVMGLHRITTTAGSAVSWVGSNVVLSQFGSVVAPFGTASQNTHQLQPGLGIMSATTNATVSAFDMSLINTVASGQRPYFQLLRES